MTSDCHDPKACLAMLERLSEYLDDELDALTCEDIQRHASRCIACKVCLETLKRTIALCKNVETPPVPEAFSLRLRQTIADLSGKTGTGPPRRG